jgi:uncharacterized membrane protein
LLKRKRKDNKKDVAFLLVWEYFILTFQMNWQAFTPLVYARENCVKSAITVLHFISYFECYDLFLFWKLFLVLALPGFGLKASKISRQRLYHLSHTLSS